MNRLRVAIVNSNCVSINRNTKKGTEIFDYILIQNLAKKAKKNNLAVTAFASGDSHLSVPVESINHLASFADRDIGIEHHKTYEIALVSKAFSMQKKFDVYHVNLGNGDVVLPFAPFVKKPIIVTMHGSFLESKYSSKYLSLFNDLPNIGFVSISNSQRAPLPDLNYIGNVYHGIDAKRTWRFNPVGDEYIMWAGRAIREKGLKEVVKCIVRTGKKARLFPIIKDDSPKWIKDLKVSGKPLNSQTTIAFDTHRSQLAHHYQSSKLFLMPIQWEEPFGMVMIESMGCGTPVVAFARGSAPEIIKDGQTGFLINPSNEMIRGDYIIKKTGIEGLCEAIERIFAMPKDDYMGMRRACREHVKQNFTVDRMVARYVEIYRKATTLA